MKLIIILIIIYPFNSISSQQGCCEFLEKLSERKQWFKTEFNNDSTNHRLVVWDTILQKIILKYDYGIGNPYLNLEGDFYGEAYRLEKKLALQSLFERMKKRGAVAPNKRDQKKKADFFNSDPSFRRSRYTFKNFHLDSINFNFKELIQQLDFPYCESGLRVSTISKTVSLNKNNLISILTGRTNRNPVSYLVVHDLVELNSWRNRQVERRLTVINTRGDKYSVLEKYELGEDPKFTHSRFGISKNDFDIIELDSTLLLVTYVDKKINIYDIKSGERIRTIATEIIPNKYKALKMNIETVVFIPKPIRIGGYDMRRHIGIKGNHIDFSRIKDYDESKTTLIVYDLLQDKVYTKEYRIDRIEKIKGFDNMKILFNDGTTENIELSFTIQEKK